MSFDPWTLGFQAVNVLVLVWLLHRFFWKPVAAMIAARQTNATEMLESAKALQAEAESGLAEIAITRAGLAAERDAILAASRNDAETARDALLAEARAQADALHDTAKAAGVRAAEALQETAIADAQRLAVTIAGELLARLDGTATDAAFLGWLVEGLTALSDADRKALASANLDVFSATKQDRAARDRIAAAIAEALGAPATLNFRTDPALLAGLELHSPHFTLRNSWRAELARIAAALGDEDALRDAA
jgi:F-type H+-transporting ATPase subunit b